MFPAKKKPAAPTGAMIGKAKPPMGGGKFGGSGMGGAPKPKSPMDDLESPDPVEGPMDDGSGDDGSDDGSDDAGMPDMSAGSGYGAKLEKDIESVGAALGMEPGQAKKAAGAFFAAAAQCLSGGDESDAGGEGEPDGDEMIDTGSAGPGRYGQ